MFFRFLLYQEEEGISIVFSGKSVTIFVESDEFSGEQITGPVGSPYSLFMRRRFWRSYATKPALNFPDLSIIIE